MFKIIDEDLDIEKIALSGQCFRMNKVGSKWQIVAMDKLCYATYNNENSETIFECPDEDNDYWKNYFDLYTEYSVYRKSVEPSDEFLNSAVEYGKGIRILKQDPWEMLITFIISQRRSIPSIKTCVERICKNWGVKICDGVYSFPSPEALSKASMDELLDTGLGYRAEYIYLVCKRVLSGDLDVYAFSELDDDSLFSKLTEIRGVGPKVANCVSLFGYYRVAAFPVDVWIDRVQKQYYNGIFPIEKYSGFSGIMQQYIFFYIRSLK